jgi:hypothetical protein
MTPPLRLFFPIKSRINSFMFFIMKSLFVFSVLLRQKEKQILAPNFDSFSFMTQASRTRFLFSPKVGTE